MKKMIFVLCALAVLAFTVISCDGNSAKTVEVPPAVELPETSYPLGGTSWKLAAIVDAENGMSRVPDDVRGERYTLTFNENGGLSGFSSLNSIGGNYSVDYGAGTLFLDLWRTDKCCESDDGGLYLFVLFGRPLKFRQYPQELRIYYNDDKKYLKFNKIEEVPTVIEVPETSYPLGGTSWKLAAIVDVENGMSRIPDNDDVRGERYTLTFKEDGGLSGRGYINSMRGSYSVDNDAGTLTMSYIVSKVCCDSDDGRLYIAVLSGAHRIRQYPQELRIYYNDDKEYFKFNKVDSPGNPLVGEWREVRSTDVRGISVIFTDTTLTAGSYDYDLTIVNQDGIVELDCKELRCYVPWYDNARYLLLGNDTLEILDRTVMGVQQICPYKRSIVFHSNDTLEINAFAPTGDMASFPYNFSPITLYRR